MQNTQLENYLGNLRSHLNRLGPAQREAEISEVGQHLEAMVAWHIQQGHQPEEAARLAITQFGKAEHLGRDLNRLALQKQIGSSARWVAKSFLIWCGLLGAEFLFFSSMNNQPTDFPYHLGDRLLLAATMATAALFCGHFYSKAMEKRKANCVTS